MLLVNPAIDICHYYRLLFFKRKSPRTGITLFEALNIADNENQKIFK